jgi:hypothetical protein
MTEENDAVENMAAVEELRQEIVEQLRQKIHEQHAVGLEITKLSDRVGLLDKLLDLGMRAGK